MLDASGPFNTSPLPEKMCLYHRHGIDGVIDRLAHQLVVEGLEIHVHGHEIHAKAGNLFYPDARVFGDSINFLDGQIADYVGLA